jgi:hypothetical protein
MLLPDTGPQLLGNNIFMTRILRFCPLSSHGSHLTYCGIENTSSRKMASAGATEVDERLQSHNDLYEEEDLIINGQLNLSRYAT